MTSIVVRKAMQSTAFACALLGLQCSEAMAGDLDNLGKAINRGAINAGKAGEKGVGDTGKAIEKAVQGTGRGLKKQFTM